MEIVVRRPRKTLASFKIPTSALFGVPYPRARCDHLGCEEVATEHCSGHGVRFCRRHFQEHRDEWHCGSSWELPLRVGQC